MFFLQSVNKGIVITLTKHTSLSYDKAVTQLAQAISVLQQSRKIWIVNRVLFVSLYPRLRESLRGDYGCLLSSSAVSEEKENENRDPVTQWATPWTLTSSL